MSSPLSLPINKIYEISILLPDHSVRFFRDLYSNNPKQWRQQFSDRRGNVLFCHDLPELIVVASYHFAISQGWPVECSFYSYSWQ